MESVKGSGACLHVNAVFNVFLEQAEGIVGIACQKTVKGAVKPNSTPRRVGGSGQAVWHILLL